MDKFKTLLVAFREVAILVIANIEDYLDTPYDRSALAKRRAKAKGYMIGVDYR